MANGDRLTGKLMELDKGAISIETLGQVAKVPLSRVLAIEFGGSRLQESAFKYIVGLRDGSLLYVDGVRADDKRVEVDVSGVKLSGGAADDIVAIQSLDGAIVYLSDLDGADYRSVPYLSIKWPYVRDKNVLGEPIVVRGERYLKGIGMHSASRLTYRFDKEYKRFESSVALDESAKGRGSVVFGVHVLRDGKWVEASKSDVVRGDAKPQAVSVDLRGAKGITLTVDFADRGDELDHAVWLDARLVK
jgi:hypothetical protein